MLREGPGTPHGAATLQGLWDLTFPCSSPHITTCLSLLPLLQALVSRSTCRVLAGVVYSRVSCTCG